MTCIRNQARILSASLLLMFTGNLSLFSQGITTGTISGSVVDAQGALIAGAHVVILETSTGVQVGLESNESGAFAARSLPAGTYKVTISHDGFSALSVEKVVVTAGGDTALGQEHLAIGSSTTMVEVTGGTSAMLQTDQSQITTSIPTEAIQSLPVNGRLDNLISLSPGTVKAHDGGGGSPSNGDSYSINGQRSLSNNFELDGQANNDNYSGGPQVIFQNSDAIKEVQVISSNFSAQYGRNMGGVINYITKNGTNSYHGTAYEYYIGSFLNSIPNANKTTLNGYCAPGQTPAANACKAAAVPRFNDNRFGGTAGGRILRDKLWYFGGLNLERTRKGQSASSSSVATPTPAGLATLHSALPTNNAVNALINQGPYGISAGNPVPVGTKTYQTFTVGTQTVSNVEFANVQRFIPAVYNDQDYIGRLDYQPYASDHFFIRYIYQKQSNTALGGIIPTGYFYNKPQTAHSIGGDWTHTFSPSWVNQLRYSFQQNKLAQEGGTQANCLAANQNACTSSVGISGSVGYGYGNGSITSRIQKVTQVQDNATWAHGRHLVSFGGDFTYQNSPTVFLSNYTGVFTFTSFANYLNNVGTVNLSDGNPLLPFKEPDFSLYVQDDFKIMPSLTLNLGLRYEFFGQAINLLHDRSVAQQTGSKPFWDTNLPLSQTTYPYTPPRWKNYQPRLGFAYNPAGLTSLVVRGAYSIQFDPSVYVIFLNNSASAPVINLGTVTCSASITCISAAGATAAETRSQLLQYIPEGAGINPNTRNLTNSPPNFQNPYVQTFQLGLQYSVKRLATVTAAYVSNRTSKQFQSLNANPYLLDVANAFPSIIAPSALCSDTAAGSVDNGRLKCGSSNVRQRANTAFSEYNGLQTSFQTQNYHGVTAFVNYMFSKTISNGDSLGPVTAGTSTPSYSSTAFAQNPLDTDRAERGVADISFPNVFSFGIVYTVPAAHFDKSWINRAINGFTVSPAYSYNGGQRWTPIQSYASAVGGTTDNTSSYCDKSFAAAWITWDSCRPILSNKKAPIGVVGIYVADPTSTVSTGGTGYYNYSSSNYYNSSNLSCTPGSDPTCLKKLDKPIAATDAHYIYNNRTIARMIGNPFGGVSRAPEVGQKFSNLDLAIEKTTPINEHLSTKLYLNIFNVTNTNFLGTPDAFITDTTFASNGYNSGYYGGATGVAANSVPASRYIQLGGKIVF
ncbi:TonB-dependent receptor [Granulicella sibirica]|uniref:Oar protein n=1 Tax=Granulicella sibirica TaxID=2479048 RepID=A0A4Q0SYL4_9BACT|nr:TonB-dependent receptor [Granulicella sibirica]RXH54718.1 Oar protein [Granulicella sibirica]